MKVGIVGASSLLGRELADAIGETVLAAAEVVLLDEESESGRVTAVGDEPALIQRIERASFERMDLCFFAGGTEETTKYWTMARDAGSGVVDLTDTLRAEAGVMLGSPWVDGIGGIDVATVAVIPAHGIAVMLGLVAARCGRLGLKTVAATVLVPASERGQTGLDEMQRQAVSLLTFQPVPKEEFDAQVAFNLVPQLGEAARMTIESTDSRIRADYAIARAGGLPALALQMVHAPVFHGYGVSMLLEFSGPVTSEAVSSAVSSGGHVTVAGMADEPPSNVSAAGQGEIVARFSEDSDCRVWVWMVADNVRMTALHAIACGMEMQRLRPRGKVQ